MLGNIVDHRTDRSNPDCDAVFEPSTHDNAKGSDGTERFGYEEATASEHYFHASDLSDTSVRDAALYAETQWPFAVTVFLYDKGMRPLE